MIVPEIVNFLLTLRYPGAERGKQNWVCYRGTIQIIFPMIPPGISIHYTVRPLQGVHAWLGYSTKFGTDTVPNTFTGTISRYGTTPYGGTLSQRIRDDVLEDFHLVTEQEPTYVSITNISPLVQRIDIIGDYIVIPSSQDLVTVVDALRRLHTSTESERLLQQIAHLLGVITGQPQKPLPSIGGGG